MSKLVLVIMFYAISAFTNSLSAQEIDNFCPLAQSLEARGNSIMATAAYANCAENSNNVEAIYTLASRYYNGQGTKNSSFKLAASLFKQASFMGHVPSQVKYGVLFWRGEGVERNPVEAYAWFTVAVQTGNDKTAESYKSRITLDMTKEQTEAGNQRAEAIIEKIKEKASSSLPLTSKPKE